MSEKKSILFLCTGNSCRSQMAEGFARAMHADNLNIYSAGIERHGLNPSAVKVMEEAGVDISVQESQTLEDLPVKNFDYVITVCSHADSNCPLFPGDARKFHHGFDDPPALAKQASSEEDALDCYRLVRDQIQTFIYELPGWLMEQQIPSNR